MPQPQETSPLPCSVKLVGLPSETLPQVWPLVSPEIERVLAYQVADSMASVYDKLVSGDYQLWAAFDGNAIKGLFITTIQAGAKQVCTIVYAVGHSFDEWAHLRHDIEKWAKVCGCHFMEIICRPGFERKLDDYKKTHIVMSKPL